MKIYLVNPPAVNGIKMVREGRCMQRKGAWTTVWPPVTLATMAAMLLKDGIEVKLNDCIVEEISFGQLKINIEEFKPDLVVINTATASIYSDLDCARIAKEVFPEIKALAFGLHVTALPEEAFLMDPFLDYIIRGEPEFCLLELDRQLKNGDNQLFKIKGLSFRNGSRIEHNQERAFQDDLNTLPFPAWELIDIKNYLLPFSREPFLLVTTSKGCPHSCLFCPAKPFYGNRVRLRDAKIIADEMEYIKNRFGVSQFLIWSESFTEYRDYVVGLCEDMIYRRLDVRWVCNSRVDKVDKELLGLMRRAGCWMIGYGVESGSQQILDAAGKDISVKQIENAVTLAKASGMEVVAHVIFGLPGETMKTGIDTINWLNKLNIDFAQFYCAVPWPSTILYKMAKEKGWLVSGDWALYEQNNYVMDTGSIRPRQVEYLRRLAMFKFYSSPKRAFKMLRAIDSFKKLKIFLATLKEFIKWI
ncbi:MAG: radical SAM protein [Candidatus Omnitrophica bacterium]|nr:radical SAM protein [Candidatus Omnitrophota bacterium]